MANTYLGEVRRPHDRTVQTEYSYPANCYVKEYFCPTSDDPNGIPFHEIVYAGAPSTSFNNAPNGSRLWNPSGAAGANLWIKVGTVGKSNGVVLTDGTWTDAVP